MSAGFSQEMENIYSAKVLIDNTKVNMFRQMRLSAVAAELQRCTSLHCDDLGIGAEKMRNNGLFWGLAEQHIRINRLPRPGEQIRIETWPKKHRYIVYPRTSRFVLEETGEVLLSSDALWTPVDFEKRNAVSLEKYGLSVPGESEEAFFGFAAFRTAEIRGMAAVRASFSMIDSNGHVNNARYLDLCDDYVLSHNENSTPKEVLIEYRKEIRPDEVFALKWGDQDGLWYVTGETDGICFRIYLIY